MRPGEAYALRWEHILFEDGGGLIMIVAGKTKAARRQLPMVAEVYAALTRRYDDAKKPEQGWLFPTGAKSGHVEGTGKFHAKAIEQLAAAHAVSEKIKDGDWAQRVADATNLSPEFVTRHADVIHLYPYREFPDGWELSGVRRFFTNCQADVRRGRRRSRTGVNACRWWL
jgi:hypothetical protein